MKKRKRNHFEKRSCNNIRLSPKLLQLEDEMKVEDRSGRSCPVPACSHVFKAAVTLGPVRLLSRVVARVSVPQGGSGQRHRRRCVSTGLSREHDQCQHVLRRKSRLEPRFLQGIHDKSRPDPPPRLPLTALSLSPAGGLGRAAGVPGGRQVLPVWSDQLGRRLRQGGSSRRLHPGEQLRRLDLGEDVQPSLRLTFEMRTNGLEVKEAEF